MTFKLGFFESGAMAFSRLKFSEAAPLLTALTRSDTAQPLGDLRIHGSTWKCSAVTGADRARTVIYCSDIRGKGSSAVKYVLEVANKYEDSAIHALVKAAVDLPLSEVALFELDPDNPSEVDRVRTGLRATLSLLHPSEDKLRSAPILDVLDVARLNQPIRSIRTPTEALASSDWSYRKTASFPMRSKFRRQAALRSAVSSGHYALFPTVAFERSGQGGVLIRLLPKVGKQTAQTFATDGHLSNANLREATLLMNEHMARLPFPFAADVLEALSEQFPAIATLMRVAYHAAASQFKLGFTGAPFKIVKGKESPLVRRLRLFSTESIEENRVTTLGRQRQVLESLSERLVSSSQRWTTTLLRSSIKDVLEKASVAPQVVQRGQEDVIIIGRSLLQSFENPHGAAQLAEYFGSRDLPLLEAKRPAPPKDLQVKLPTI